MPTYPLGFHLNLLTNPWVEKLTQTHTLIEQKPTGFRVAGTHCHLYSWSSLPSTVKFRNRHRRPLPPSAHRDASLNLPVAPTLLCRRFVVSGNFRVFLLPFLVNILTFES